MADAFEYLHAGAWHFGGERLRQFLKRILHEDFAGEPLGAAPLGAMAP